MGDESRNPQGGQHSATRPGESEFRKSKQKPGVISKRGNPQEEAARFPMEGFREERRGETLIE